MNDIPLSLYVHFPWCVRKCPYCDFNSHQTDGDFPEAQYIDALIIDLQAQSSDESRGKLSSIFLGGGTPSLFSPESIERLLAEVRRRFDITNIEITMEANPGTFDAEHFSGYFDAGVNRLSLGAQSFSNESLKALGRIHTTGETITAFNGARAAGFKRINIDIMHGLPGQTSTGALSDLEQAIALKPDHISWYELTIEPNTYFYRFPPIVPDDNTLADITQLGQTLLTDSGYSQYEISAYAKPGEQSQHNLNYWHFGDYLGIGAGAHGKVTRGPEIFRTTKSRVPKDYLSNHTKTHTTQVPADELLLEFLMNALRLNAGFSIRGFEYRTGIEAKVLIDSLAEAAAKLLIDPISGDRVQTTELGRRFLNELLARVG